jgi:predicted RND superfamily exporter protein
MRDSRRLSIIKTVPNKPSSLGSLPKPVPPPPLETFFSRHARHVLLVTACLLPLVGWGKWYAGGVRDNSVLGWLPERSPVTRAYRDFLRAFGPDEAVLASWEGCALDEPSLERLAEAVEHHRAAAVAGGPAWFAGVATGTRLRETVAAAARLSPTEAAERLAGTFVGPDGRTTCAVVTLERLDDDARRDAVAWVRQAAADAAGIEANAVRLTGDAVIGVAIDTENERTAATWSRLAVVNSVFLAWLALGSLRLGGMVLTVAGVASLAIEAAINLSGVPLNMLVALVPVVTFVLGISTAVHLAGYWTDALPQHGLEGAPAAAVSQGWQPSVVAALTTVLGFGSLCVSQVRPVWHFGLFAAAGTVLAFALALVLLPALLQVFPGGEASRPRRGGEWPAFVAATQRAVEWRRATLATSLLVLVIAGWGLGQLRTEVRPAWFLAEESPWRQDLEWFDDHIAPFQTVDVVLAYDAAAPDLGDRAAVVQEVEQRLRRLDDMHGSLSAASFLPAELLGSAERGSVRSVARRGVIDGRLRRQLPDLVAAGMVAEDGDQQLWRVSLQARHFTAARQAGLDAEVRHIVAAAAADLALPPPAEIVCTGSVPLVIAAQRELLDALLQSFLLAFITIAAVLAMFLRSFGAGLLAMVPNLVPVVIVFGLWGWAGRRLDVGGMMTASVALGIAVDDTVHLLTWFRRLRGRHADRRDRVAAALRKTAVPIARTSFILAPGFGIFAFCGFQPIAQFGMLLFLLLAVAVIADLVLLPALLAGPVGRWFDRVGAGEAEKEA